MVKKVVYFQCSIVPCAFALLVKRNSPSNQTQNDVFYEVLEAQNSENSASVDKHSS